MRRRDPGQSNRGSGIQGHLVLEQKARHNLDNFSEPLRPPYPPNGAFHPDKLLDGAPSRQREDASDVSREQDSHAY